MVLLTELDARNPVAFLASLGALRLASAGDTREVSMSWEERYGTWLPSLGGDTIDDEQSVITAIVRGHESRDLDRELGWERDIMKLTRDEVRRLLTERLRDGQDNEAVSVAAHVGELPERRSGDAPYTPFRLIPRKGRAKFLEAAIKLSKPRRTEDDVRAALFQSWTYSKGNNLAWDPGATLPSRAYTAEAPTHFGPLAVPGAMLLAIAALPYFPLQPGRSSVMCRGFGGTRGTRFVWPIWSKPMTEAAVRILLGLPALYEQVPNAQILDRHGVVARVVAPIASYGSDARVLSWGRPQPVEPSR